MRKLALTVGVAALAFAVVLSAQSLGSSKGKSQIKGDTLTGYQEAAGAGAAGISSKGTGQFNALLDEDNKVISYTLTYTGLVVPATVAHIHFGNRSTSGGVVVFFCGGGTKPQACPPGTTDVATLTGTFTPADVGGGAAGQGLAAGEWDEFVAAIRAGETYVNVHNGTFPGGEIRAQINNKDQTQPA